MKIEKRELPFQPINLILETQRELQIILVALNTFANLAHYPSNDRDQAAQMFEQLDAYCANYNCNDEDEDKDD